MKKENNKGITLIALIVTIVILLIVSGITIASISNDSGVINQAQGTKEEAQTRTIMEKIKSDLLKNEITKMRETTDEEFEAILSKYGTIKKENGEITGITIEDGYFIDIEDIKIRNGNEGGL